MERLTFENLIPQLVEAVPEVPVDPDYLADHLTYPAFNDLTRFVIPKLGAEEHKELLTRIFQFIEAAAQTGDAAIHDVLWDALYEIAVAPTDKSDKAKMYMGPKTKKLFRQLERQIYGR